MPLIQSDPDWTVGAVRVRASSPDPLAGLRGMDYIKARGLAQPVQRLDAGTTSNRDRALLKLVKRAPVRLLVLNRIRRPA